MVSLFVWSFPVLASLVTCGPIAPRPRGTDGAPNDALYVPMTFYLKREPGANASTSAGWYTNLKEQLKVWISGYLATGESF